MAYHALFGCLWLFRPLEQVAQELCSGLSKETLFWGLRRLTPTFKGVQAYIHIAKFCQFRAQGNLIRNAHIHGMLCTTRGSIAYIATQVYPLLYDYTCLLTFNSEVHFALSSSSVFSRTDKICDSEHFYNSLLELLYDLEEQKEVEELLSWWNRWVFSEMLLY